MSFPTNPALEKAVIADAENDLPRLVYADWLDEHGDPARATFIRVQCALWDKNPADPDYPDLIEQRREVFDCVKWRHDLKPKLPEWVSFSALRSNPDEDGFECGFHRGFPYIAGSGFGEGDSESEEAHADRFASLLPELFATTTIRGLGGNYAYCRHLQRILSVKECVRFKALSVVDSAS